MGVPMQQPQRCKDCDNANPVDGFKCPAQNAAHEPCSYCHQLMPVRNLERTKCFRCNRSACGQYWPNSPCSHYFKKLREWNVAFTPTLLLQNAHETSILQNYLLANNIDTVTFFQNVLLVKFENKELALPDFPNASLDSYCCSGCTKKVASDLAYEYRRAIPRDDLPAEVTARSDCHWGKNCRTAPHNASHAGRFNHVCPQTRNQ